MISLGPQGKGVMISRQSPREIFITRRGVEILEIFRGCHPQLDMIINTVKVSIITSVIVIVNEL